MSDLSIWRDEGQSMLQRLGNQQAIEGIEVKWGKRFQPGWGFLQQGQARRRVLFGQCGEYFRGRGFEGERYDRVLNYCFQNAYAAHVDDVFPVGKQIPCAFGYTVAALEAPNNYAGIKEHPHGSVT